MPDINETHTPEERRAKAITIITFCGAAASAALSESITNFGFMIQHLHELFPKTTPNIITEVWIRFITQTAYSVSALPKCLTPTGSVELGNVPAYVPNCQNIEQMGGLAVCMAVLGGIAAYKLSKDYLPKSM